MSERIPLGKVLQGGALVGLVALGVACAPENPVQAQIRANVEQAGEDLNGNFWTLPDYPSHTQLVAVEPILEPSRRFRDSLTGDTLQSADREPIDQIASQDNLLQRAFPSPMHRESEMLVAECTWKLVLASKLSPQDLHPATVGKVALFLQQAQDQAKQLLFPNQGRTAGC